MSLYESTLEPKSLKEEIQELKEMISDPKQAKKIQKKFKIPMKGRVSKGKVAKCYSTIIIMDEKRNISFSKQQLDGGTIRIEDTWHAVEPDDVYHYKGKPVILIVKHRKNPYNPFREKNETYGQKYIMARMMRDAIKLKGKVGGKVILWILLGVGAVYALTQGGIF